PRTAGPTGRPPRSPPNWTSGEMATKRSGTDVQDVAEMDLARVGGFARTRPEQILWINLLTLGLPGVAMGSEPGAPGAMSRPPRSPQESVLGAGLALDVVRGGTVIAACALGGGVAGWYGHGPWQSMIFLVLGFAQLGVALPVRASRRPWRAGTPWPGAAVPP